MIYNENTVISSLQQSAYDALDMMFKEYQSKNPLFKYDFRFGSNYDEYTDTDTFNIVMQTGNINLLPAHYTNIEIDGHSIPYIPFAGTVEIALSIINPVSVKTINNVPFAVNQEAQIDYNLDNQSNENYGVNYDIELADEISENKIQDTARLLEGLVLFLHRKGIKVNNFEFTFIPDMPLISGELQIGEYRLLEDMFISCKFQDTTYFDIDSGENTEVYFKLDGNWEKLYQVVDFSFTYGAVDTDFPVSPKVLTQNIQNQLLVEGTISTPAINNLGANKKLVEYFDLAQIEKLQNVEMKFTRNGKDWKKTKVNIKVLDKPSNIDTFGTTVYSLKVIDPITDLSQEEIEPPQPEDRFWHTVWVGNAPLSFDNTTFLVQGLDNSYPTRITGTATLWDSDHPEEEPEGYTEWNETELPIDETIGDGSSIWWRIKLYLVGGSLCCEPSHSGSYDDYAGSITKIEQYY